MITPLIKKRKAKIYDSFKTESEICFDKMVALYALEDFNAKVYQDGCEIYIGQHNATKFFIDTCLYMATNLKLRLSFVDGMVRLFNNRPFKENDHAISPYYIVGFSFAHRRLFKEFVRLYKIASLEKSYALHEDTFYLLKAAYHSYHMASKEFCHEAYGFIHEEESFKIDNKYRL